VRVARDDEWQRLEDGAHDGRIVLTECMSGDEGPHVEETVGPALGVAIDDGEVRADRLRRIECHGQ
jgi:hypothetical protein